MTRIDQEAEEAQRKLKRQNGEDPALPPFCPLFASLGNILQCDVLLGMLGAVLQWAMEPSGGHWSESMLQRVLHLIGMALLEEQQQLENIGDDDEVTFNFTLKISPCMKQCCTEQMTECLDWIMAECKNLYSKFLQSMAISFIQKSDG
ncbi:E3 ubiquitin-protein ligase UBR2-like isoform X2 [Ictalurus punctatus]|uniref:E3 ubiquitin-protein ligase n=1 Tax=Ictalurus punctatus TaxID=7998 RepID=A0A9F7RFI4_ICTPU|nr:E3 ubiquitin-protein ligase UBR2-like [Ictalurus punctatus]XP_053534463.1 E3 ubiquitin-protein ligase UBR2-like [Ictalurus punctatus]XP_053534740.1 E3 ubiquitin-protein ligase UBR2-like isoform X2 [Ictalurus punctatus]